MIMSGQWLPLGRRLSIVTGNGHNEVSRVLIMFSFFTWVVVT